MAHSLYRIGVEEYARFPGDRPDLRDWLDGADLVVGGHNGDEDRIRAEGRLHGGGVHPSLAVHRQIGDLKALLLQIPGGMEDRVVLDGGGNDVPPLVLLLLSHAPQRPVVGLAAAGGEINLLRLGVQAGGHLGPGRLQVGFGLLGKRIETGGVSIALVKIREHGLQGRIGQGRGGRMVGINNSRHGDVSFPGSSCLKYIIPICLL